MREVRARMEALARWACTWHEHGGAGDGTRRQRHQTRTRTAAAPLAEFAPAPQGGKKGRGEGGKAGGKGRKGGRKREGRREEKGGKKGGKGRLWRWRETARGADASTAGLGALTTRHGTRHARAQCQVQARAPKPPCSARASLIYIYIAKSARTSLLCLHPCIFLSRFLQVRGKSTIFGAWFGKPSRPRLLT